MAKRKRDTYIYELKNGKTIVYYGISNGPRDRIEEQEHVGKKFTHMRVFRGPMYRKNAEMLEEKYIKRYQMQHNGIPPKYNIYKTY